MLGVGCWVLDVVPTVSVVCLLTVLPTQSNAQDLARGEELYDQWCAECHGVDGAGAGSAAPYMLPQPRDFTLGVYQIRTTANGELPTDQDLSRVVKLGMPGTAMPGWDSKLSDAEIADIVAYIKSFSRFFEQYEAPDPLDFGGAPRLSEEALEEGRRFYQEIECWKCHGDAGRADGPSAPTLQDDLDFPVRAADLTKNWNFNGGGTVEDIFRRLRTGLDGSPMPSFSDLIDSGFMSDEQLWHLAQYVRSLSPEEPPAVREVIAAKRLEGALPSSLDDPLWEEAASFYIPMVGQIIEEPRWFAPTVDGLWVKAAHDDERLALLVTWSDPSLSPDPAWLEWQQRVAQAMYPLQDSVGVTQGPDMLAVQFPTTAPTGRERPYFLMGDSRRAVYLWHWSSDPDGVVEMRATGLGTAAPQDAANQTVSSASAWEAGQWRLYIERTLTTADSANQIQLASGGSVPIAFFAWDGSNGESGNMASVSSWYSIYIEQPTSANVYLSPVVAMVLTAGLGVLVIWRAQRREEEQLTT
jgi:DMSO reductase family type II enzyme heme b subunit